MPVNIIPSEIYIVTQQGPFGGMLSDAKYLTRYADAEALQKDYAARKMGYMKIFTLFPYVAIRVVWKKPEHQKEFGSIKLINARDAQFEEQINEVVARDPRILSWTYELKEPVLVPEPVQLCVRCKKPASDEMHGDVEVCTEMGQKSPGQCSERKVHHQFQRI